MSVRAALPIALVLAMPALTAPLGAQGVEYAPGTSRYDVTITTRGTQTSPIGQQSFSIGVRQRLTVDVARATPDTLVATMTLDSISVRQDGPARDVSRYQGSRFVSHLSPTGRVYSTQAPPGIDGLLAQLAEGITRLLPSYRRDLRVGLAWSDTTSDRVVQEGMEVDRRVVADYVVTGDTSIAGERTFQIRRRSTMKAAGSGTANGSAIGLTTETSSDARLLLTEKGVYLGGDSNDDLDLRITIAAQGAEILVKQSAVQTVRRTL